MEILEAIKLEAEQAHADGRMTAAKKYIACMKPIEIFIGDTRPDIAITLLPKWQQSFKEFLINDYPRHIDKANVSATTVERHIDSLRTITRAKINRGELPNLHNERRTLKPLPRRQDLRRLTQIASGLASTAIDKAIARHAAMKLIAIALMGMDVEDLLLTKASDYDGQTIYLRHLGIRAQVPAPVQTLIQLYRNQEAGSPYLFPGLSDSDDNEAIRDKIKRVAHESAVALSQLKLYYPEGFANPFTQFISLAQELGTKPDILDRLMEARYDNHNATAAVQSADYDAVMTAIASEMHLLRRAWFAIKCRGITGTSLAKAIQTNPALPPLSDEEIYTPHYIRKREFGGKITIYNDPTVDRLLFVNTIPANIRSIQREIGLKGVFYGVNTDKGKEYFSIPQREIDRLRAFLAVDDERRSVLRPDKSVIGRRVRILGGIYKGLEGVITRIRSPKSSPLFVVGIQGLCLFASPSFDPTLIEAID